MPSTHEGNYVELFTSIDDVRPPCALAGQQALTLANGKWVACDVDAVKMERMGKRRMWAWRYEIRIEGIHVLRYGSDGRIRARLKS